MIEKLPPELQQLLAGLAGLLPTALLARLLSHNKMVRAGHRRFWSRELFWEGPSAVFLCHHRRWCCCLPGSRGMAAHAVVGAISLLGPRGMEVMLTRWLEAQADGKS